MWGRYKDPLFSLANKRPVTRLVFDRHLYLALSFCQLDNRIYKGHSFRIGAATLAAESNVSDEQIRGMGRWSFNIFRKYIKNHNGNKRNHFLFFVLSLVLVSKP